MIIDDGCIDVQFTSCHEKIDTEFTSSDQQIDAEFTSCNEKIDAEFTASDEKIDIKFTSSDQKIDTHFTTSDEKIDANFGEVQIVIDTTDFPEYEGEYEVTPKVESQSLPTAEKYLLQDVLINSIPRYDVSNTSGGKTVYIG